MYIQEEEFRVKRKGGEESQFVEEVHFFPINLI